jgi:hypothetical protein
MGFESSAYFVEDGANLFDLAWRFPGLGWFEIKHNDDQLVSSSVTSTVESVRLR